MILPGDHVFVDTKGGHVDLTRFPGIVTTRNGVCARQRAGDLGLVVAVSMSRVGLEVLVLFSGPKLGWTVAECFNLVSARVT